MNLNAADTRKFSDSGWSSKGKVGQFDVGWKIFMDFWSALESLSENEFRAQKSKETTLNYIEWTDNKLFINNNVKPTERASRQQIGMKRINYCRRWISRHLKSIINYHEMHYIMVKCLLFLPPSPSAFMFSIWIRWSDATRLTRRWAFWILMVKSEGKWIAPQI